MRLWPHVIHARELKTETDRDGIHYRQRTVEVTATVPDAIASRIKRIARHEYDIRHDRRTVRRVWNTVTVKRHFHARQPAAKYHRPGVVRHDRQHRDAGRIGGKPVRNPGTQVRLAPVRPAKAERGRREARDQVAEVYFKLSHQGGTMRCGQGFAGGDGARAQRLASGRGVGVQVGKGGVHCGMFRWFERGW